MQEDRWDWMRLSLIHIFMAQNGYSDDIEAVNTALDASGNPLGYVLTVTAKDGSQGSITFSVGIQNDGTVNGYSITSISETPGLGMKAQEEPFYSQFEGKNCLLYTSPCVTVRRSIRWIC